MIGVLGALARPLLARLPPERAHRAAIAALKLAPAARQRGSDPRLGVHAFGLDFPNPLGMAAGFDKNAEVPRGLLALGFGFVEVGTLTPRPQPGNPRPRLFRLTADRALVNRLGFNNLGYDPPYVMFSANSLPESGHRKDSVKNATDTGEFVVNMATYELRDAVNITSQFVPPEVDEAALAGLEMIGSRIVKPPRVAASPVHLECKFHSSTALPARTLDGVHHVVIGRVVGVHIRDDALTPEGKLDVVKIRPLARLGYHDYTSVESSFTMRPIGPYAQVRDAGLEGRPIRARKTGSD